jgi:hypothetical protein
MDDVSVLGLVFNTRVFFIFTILELNIQASARDTFKTPYSILNIRGDYP